MSTTPPQPAKSAGKTVWAIAAVILAIVVIAAAIGGSDDEGDQVSADTPPQQTTTAVAAENEAKEPVEAPTKKAADREPKKPKPEKKKPKPEKKKSSSKPMKDPDASDSSSAGGRSTDELAVAHFKAYLALRGGPDIDWDELLADVYLTGMFTSTLHVELNGDRQMGQAMCGLITEWVDAGGDEWASKGKVTTPVNRGRRTLAEC